MSHSFLGRSLLLLFTGVGASVSGAVGVPVSAHVVSARLSTTEGAGTATFLEIRWRGGPRKRPSGFSLIAVGDPVARSPRGQSLVSAKCPHLPAPVLCFK